MLIFQHSKSVYIYIYIYNLTYKRVKQANDQKSNQ